MDTIPNVTAPAGPAAPRPEEAVSPAAEGTPPVGISAGRSTRRAAKAMAALGAVVVVVAAATFAVGFPGGPSAKAGSRSPTGPSGAAGLPVLGAAEAIEADNQELNDVGDPFVLAVPSGVDGNPKPSYVLYWTTDWQSNVPTAVSTDLIHWRRVADSLPKLPSWALVVSPPGFWSAPSGISTMTWGPSVEQTPGGWLLYYSTEDAATRRECIGVAFSSSPTGPFVDSSTAPLVCQAALGGDIDPSVVSLGAGRHALVWKNDGNSIGRPVGVWEQELSSDGRSTVGAPVRLLGADQAWEHGIIEGPAMLADTKGGWWLFFSGGTWQSDTYDTGVAWCATVAGPCRQPLQRPLLASTPTAVSPGGLDTFVAHNGQLWASYSAFPSQPADARAAMASPRVLEIAPVRSH